MKKLFILLAAVVMTASAMAEGHMKFKGVEIDGKLHPFLTALQQQKYSVLSQSEEVATLSGTFNSQNAFVCVYTTPASHTVYQVIVIFAYSGTEWSQIWQIYSTYKDRLQTKYGDPVKQVEENRCSYSQDDPLYSIKMDKAEYKTCYEGNGGKVLVSIMNLPIFGVQVCLAYLDEQNGNLNEQESIEDL